MPMLQIDNVNFNLLEKQRTALGMATTRQDVVTGVLILNREEVNALQGVISMLDAWSDLEFQQRTSIE